MIYSFATQIEDIFVVTRSFLTYNRSRCAEERCAVGYNDNNYYYSLIAYVIEAFAVILYSALFPKITSLYGIVNDSCYYIALPSLHRSLFLSKGQNSVSSFLPFLSLLPLMSCLH